MQLDFNNRADLLQSKGGEVAEKSGPKIDKKFKEDE